MLAGEFSIINGEYSDLRYPMNLLLLLNCVYQIVKTMKCMYLQGAKKIIFTSCHLGKLKLAFTSPDVISSTPKSFRRAELMSQFFCYSNCSKNITCPSGKLKTEFTSPIAKATSPRLSDITFFARCIYMHIILLLLLSLL